MTLREKCMNWRMLEDKPYTSTACSKCIKDHYLTTIGTVVHTIFADFACEQKHGNIAETDG